MRFQSFLETMNKAIQEKTEIHLPTFKYIIKSFYFFLSKTEKEKWKYMINVLTSYTNTQESMKATFERITVDNLKHQLERLKNK